MSQSILQSLKKTWEAPILTLFFLGFSAGLPFSLIWSSLSLWLVEAGVEKSAIPFFSWALLVYSFKFIWAPIIDRLPVPILNTLLGKRRAWMLLTQTLIIAALCIMALIDPNLSENSAVLLGFAALFLGFAAASQDIVIDAYRIEAAEAKLQGLLSAFYVTGYRVAMITSGAGALFLAAELGSSVDGYNFTAWSQTYLLMAALMLVGVTCTLFIKEPQRTREKSSRFKNNQYLNFFFQFLFMAGCFIFVFMQTGNYVIELKTMIGKLLFNSAIGNFIGETLRFLFALATVMVMVIILKRAKLLESDLAYDSYVSPIKNFFKVHGLKTALLILLFIGLYRISDVVLGVIAYIFYTDIGFSKQDIAAASKVYGLIMLITGSIVGGVLTVRFGIMRMLLIGAVLTIPTNMLFMLLASVGKSYTTLYFVIGADNFTGGLATTAFIAFMSSLVNLKFTASQYAIFSSLMTLIPKLIGGYSGVISEAWGYNGFFLFSALLGIPVILLIFILKKHIKIKDEV